MAGNYKGAIEFEARADLLGQSCLHFSDRYVDFVAHGTSQDMTIFMTIIIVIDEGWGKGKLEVAPNH